MIPLDIVNHDKETNDNISIEFPRINLQIKLSLQIIRKYHILV